MVARCKGIQLAERGARLADYQSPWWLRPGQLTKAERASLTPEQIEERDRVRKAAWIKRYDQSANGKATTKRFAQSDKGKAIQKRYEQKPEVKVRNLEKTKRWQRTPRGRATCWAANRRRHANLRSSPEMWENKLAADRAYRKTPELDPIRGTKGR